MIVVNASSRQFTILAADQIFGVENDAGSEVKYFQAPRYVGNNLDLAGSFLRINYRNANGETDSYLIEDVTVDGDNIQFSWKLTPKVTAYKGDVKYVLCATGPDLKVAWHTTLGAGKVLEGLEPDNSHVENDTTDVVAQLIAMVNSQTAAVEAAGTAQIQAIGDAAVDAEAAAVAQIEAKGAGTLATIPGDYTATVNAVQSAANAIRGKVSGEVIRVDDVSPMKHYPVVSVHGKNLIPFPYRQANSSEAGGTFIVQDDGGILASGTPTGYASLNLYQGEPIARTGKVVLSYSGDLVNVSLAIAIYDGNENVLLSKETWQSAVPIVLDLDLYPSATKWIVYLKRGTPGIEMRGVAYPQLEIGEVATEYTSYIDPTTVTVTKCGKNLVSTDVDSWDKTFPFTNQNGVMSSINGDGASNYQYYKTVFPRGKYVANAKFSGYPRFLVKLFGSDGRILTNADVPSFGGYNDYYKGFYFHNNTTVIDIPPEATHWQFGVIFVAGSDAVNTNLTISELQLELSDKATKYEPYDGEVRIPESDGATEGFKSVSPTMTILTDTTGVNIYCEYSRDTNKVIEDLLNKITALGG